MQRSHIAGKGKLRRALARAHLAPFFPTLSVLQINIITLDGHGGAKK